MADVDMAEGGSGPEYKRKGRGHRDFQDMEQRYGRARFSELKPNTGPGPTASVEGWVVFVTGVHEEAQVRVCSGQQAEHGGLQLACSGPATASAMDRMNACACHYVTGGRLARGV
jgi:RNA-binding protein 8A